MSTENLIKGLQVLILANEFLEAAQKAVVEDTKPEGELLLLRLNEVLVKDGRSYAYAVASPRLERDHISEQPHGKSLGCGVTWIPTDKFRTNDPFDLSWWRGGAAAITDIKPILTGTIK
jgi:hypothetical protein